MTYYTFKCDVEGRVRESLYKYQFRRIYCHAASKIDDVTGTGQEPNNAFRDFAVNSAQWKCNVIHVVHAQTSI